MRYLLLIAEEPPAGQPTQAEIAATMGDYNAFGSWLRERGWNEGGEALQDVTTATTVSIRDGQRIVTDGPYAETKEHLGGFYLIDVPTPRRRDRGRVTDPGRDRRGGSRSARSWRWADRSRRRRRPRLPRGARPRDRDAHPRPRRLRPRRGGGRRRVRHGARAVAGGRDPGEPRGVDRHHGPEPGDRPGAPRAGVRPEGGGHRARCGVRCGGPGRRAPGSGGGRDASDPRRPAAADLHLLSPGAGTGGLDRAHAAHARRA